MPGYSQPHSTNKSINVIIMTYILPTNKHFKKQYYQFFLLNFLTKIQNVG